MKLGSQFSCFVIVVVVRARAMHRSMAGSARHAIDHPACHGDGSSPTDSGEERVYASVVMHYETFQPCIRECLRSVGILHCHDSFV